MADEEIMNEQKNKVTETAETENGVSPENDMNSLINELDGQKTKPESSGSSGDLSSLVTEKTDSTEVNIDEMLESATDTTSSMENSSAEEEGVDLELLQKMPLTMTFRYHTIQLISGQNPACLRSF